MNNLRGRGGFTLLEMLIVICIITILAAMLLSTITMVQNRTKARLALTDITNLYAAFEQFKFKYGEYPNKTKTDLMTEGNSGGLKNKLIKLLVKEKMFNYEYSQMENGGKSDSDVLRDPFGIPYIIILDNSANGPTSTFANITFQKTGIYIYSTGGQKPGTGSGKALDNAATKRNCIYIKDE